MKIRKARSKDVESIKKMDDLSLKARHSVYYFLKNLDKILVAEDEGKVIGYIMAKGEEVSNLVVHPDFRKRGIGKKLVKKIMEKSKRLVCRTRKSNKDAYEFLEKLGFKKIREIESYYSNGENAIEMEWEKG